MIVSCDISLDPLCVRHQMWYNRQNGLNIPICPACFSIQIVNCLNVLTNALLVTYGLFIPSLNPPSQLSLQTCSPRKGIQWPALFLFLLPEEKYCPHHDMDWDI